MLSGVIGITGALLLIGCATSFEDGKGARFAAFLFGAVACFAVAVMSVTKTPDFLLQECDRYSRFANSC
ncbi:hypothetical protein EL18_02067 [Nitratireductor basaltis]|uniref:Uncharacterized protein n=1 Tax=Nitratireductor basaltis TaxID=472175 RepID=A0A084UDI9_9HYPH|nr:hypothetical protein EL18_02067 [Nitratireductor basaltis]